MTKTVQLLKTNLINEQGKNEKLYEVSTPLSISIVGKGYPIHDYAGELYTLDDSEMLIKFEGHNNTIGFLINDNVHTIPIDEHEFSVSENEKTAFITLVMSFKLYAKTEKQAREGLHLLLNDNQNTLQDFDIYDGKQDRLYDVDILMYQLSGLYKVTAAAAQ